MGVSEPRRFGALLRHHRERAGLTQEELAERAGLSAHGIGDLESGRRTRPRRDTANRLVAALGLAPFERDAFEAAVRAARLARQTPPGGGPAAQASPAHAAMRRSRQPLVGREREQALLRERLAAALDGRGGVVLVGGEAGVGKTALAEWLLVEAAALGALALTGQCYDRTETPPYGPWLEVPAQYPVGPGLPLLPTVLTEPRALAGFASQASLFEQVVGWFAAVAAARPLVLLLDDQHWADPASLDLLRVVARRATALRLLVLVAYRDDALTRRHPLYALLPLLDREAHAARLDLRRFEVESVRALVTAHYTLREADADRLVAWLVRRAEGNAFFTTQLLRALEDEGVLTATAGGWALGDPGAVGLPAPLRQVLDARLARLGEEAGRRLALAAVIGQEVPLALWATVAETDEDGLLDAIDAAVEARLLVATPDGRAVRFAHALIREALYEGLVATRRRVIHRRIAEALASLVAPDPAAVADHFQRAGDGQAAAWLVRAGERAQRAYAWVSAAGRYEAALALLAEQGTAPLERARLLHTLAQLLRYTDLPRAIALLADAVALAAEGGDLALVAAVRFDRGHLLCLANDYGAGLPELRATLPALEALPPAHLAALPTAVVLGLRPDEAYHRGALLQCLASGGHLAEAVEAGAEALPLTPGTSQRALGAIFLLHFSRGEPVLADRANVAATIAARAAGQHREVVHQLRLRAELLGNYRTDDLAAWAALAAEVDAALPAAREADPDLTATEILYLQRLIRGDWDELARWGQAHPARLPMFQAILAGWRGEESDAWALVRAFLPDGPATVPGTVSLDAVGVQSMAIGLALEAGNLPEARAWLEARDRWLAWSGAVLHLSEQHKMWTQYHRAAGDLPQARKHAEAALVHATDPRQPLALFGAHLLLGELGTATCRYAAAATSLEAALALADACAEPWARALTLLAVAELGAATNDRGAARAALAEARTICEALGARPALARADALAARLAVLV